MRGTNIESNKYLGPFPQEITMVQVGSTQRMHFVSGDACLYCLVDDSRGERIEQEGSPIREEDKMIPKQA